MRYRRTTGTPLRTVNSDEVSTPGVASCPQRHGTPRDASARFACPTRAGSAGGCTMAWEPAGVSPPLITTSRPSTMRFPSWRTARAAATNDPALDVAMTLAGGATRQANGLRSSARSSSGSSAASPTHHPGASDCAGNDTLTADRVAPPGRSLPGVANPRAVISPRFGRPPPMRIVTGTGCGAPAAPTTEPLNSITAAPSETVTAAIPRFATARPGARASTLTPLGTSA